MHDACQRLILPIWMPLCQSPHTTIKVLCSLSDMPWSIYFPLSATFIHLSLLHSTSSSHYSPIHISATILSCFKQNISTHNLAMPSTISSLVTPDELQLISNYPVLPPPEGVTSNFMNYGKPQVVVSSLLLCISATFFMNCVYMKSFIIGKYKLDDRELLLDRNRRPGDCVTDDINQ